MEGEQQMKRFDHCRGYDCPGMEECADGDYVFADEALAEIARLQKELAAAHEESADD